jgi:general secretion pathway protein J
VTAVSYAPVTGLPALRRSATASCAGGFTLLELTIALVLLALLSAVLFGSLRLAGRSTDRGEKSAEAAASMRLAEEFLRTNLEGQRPQRMRKIAELPLLFSGSATELRYAADMPARVAGGGIWYFRIYVRADDADSPLVLERMVPDITADVMPDFDQAERSVLATGIETLKIGYFGREPDAGVGAESKWQDRWSDKQRLPTLIRIDVTPKAGPAWPTLYVAPREAPEAGCNAWDVARQRCAAA